MRLGSWLLVLLAAWGGVRWLEWKSTYYPSRGLWCTPADAGLGFEDVEFVSEDARRLHGWWIPVEEEAPTILVCHGNAGNIADRVWLAKDFARLGVNIFLFDYRGYGKSSGFPTERGLYRDARAAYEVVRARYADAERPPVVVYGRSLGGAVAVQLACDRPVRGLILEGTFTSARDMARVIYPWLPLGWVLSQRFDVERKIAQLSGIPKIIAHSRDDEVVPYRLGRRVYQAAAEPKVFCELTGSHNDSGWETTPSYWREIEQLLQRVRAG